MSATFATTHDRSLNGLEQIETIHDRNCTRADSSDRLQVDGMQFDSGYLSPYFITDPERMEVAFENVYVLIHERKISSRTDLIPLIEQIKTIGKPLLIIAEDVGGEVLATLVVSKLRGPLQVAAVRAPGVGDQRKKMLRDIALLTGATAISEDFDIELRNIRLSDLGQAKKITIGKNHTVLEGRNQSESCGLAKLRPGHTPDQNA